MSCWYAKISGSPCSYTLKLTITILATLFSVIGIFSLAFGVVFATRYYRGSRRDAYLWVTRSLLKAWEHGFILPHCRYVGHGGVWWLPILSRTSHSNEYLVVLHPLSNTQSQPTRQRVMYMLLSLTVAALLLPLQTTLDVRHVSKKMKERVSDKTRARILLQLPGNEGTFIFTLLLYTWWCILAYHPIKDFHSKWWVVWTQTKGQKKNRAGLGTKLVVLYVYL